MNISTAVRWKGKLLFETQKTFAFNQQHLFRGKFQNMMKNFVTCLIDNIFMADLNGIFFLSGAHKGFEFGILSVVF